MTKTPWFKWYPSDWRGDPKVRSCEPLTRYVWMEIIGLMHEAEPYGHLVLNGRPMDAKIIARVISMEVSGVKAALKELREAGVFSETDEGVIFSRRMIRDENRAKILRENGGKGGNPLLKKQTLSASLDNQSDKQPDKTQIPETRDQTTSNDVVAPAARKPAKTVRTKSKSEIDPDLKPTTQDARVAIEHGMSGPDLVREWAQFKNHHISKASTMADWSAAWRTWCGNFQKFKNARGSPRQQRGSELAMLAFPELRGQTDDQQYPGEHQSGEGSFGSKPRAFGSDRALPEPGGDNGGGPLLDLRVAGARWS